MKFRGQEGFRDKDYKTFISGKPCIVCGRPGEAHHYGGMAEGRCLGRLQRFSKRQTNDLA